MGRRYYCDYCAKVFIDDIDARKKHLNSSHHIKLRKLHYDNYRDLPTILSEELVKIPCRRFLSNGFCQFESSCKYTHYTPDQLWDIKQQVVYEEQEKLRLETEVPDIATVESWLEKYNQQKNIENDDVVSTFWSYPEHIEHRSDLPISLRKFQPEHFTHSNFSTWG